MRFRSIRQALLISILCVPALSCAGMVQRPAETVPSDPEDLLQLKAEILMAEDLGKVDQSLLAAAQGSDPGLRAMATRALGRIGDTSSLALLEERVKDNDPRVRAEAVFALGLLGESDALPALRRAAGDDRPEVRANAAAALGLLHDPESERTIVSLLRDPEPEVVAAACYALPLFDRADFAIDPLLRLIDERGEEVGMAALRALAWISAHPARLGYDDRLRARERLIPFVDSPIPEARSLAALGLAMPSVVAEADLLGRLLEEDPDPRVRFNAVRSLSFPGAPVEPFVSEALKDKDQFVVLAAVLGLGRMKGPDAVESLARVIVHDSRLWLRQQAIAMAGRVSPSRAAEMVSGLSKDVEPALREASVRLLYGRTDEQSLAIARRLLEDEDIGVRAAAIPVLAGSQRSLADELDGIMGDADRLVRIAVADAAGRRLAESGRSEADREEAFSIASRLWNEAAGPDGSGSFGVRLAAMDAAVRAGATPGVRTLLEAALRSPDSRIARRARLHHEALFGETLPDSFILDGGSGLAEYIEILQWAEKPRAAVITIERPGFIPGEFTVKLDTEAAPLSSWNFARLAEEGFYDGQEIIDVQPGLSVQSGGDEVGWQGFRSEINPSAFSPGTVAFARFAGGYSDSRWHISLATQPQLIRNSSAFGMVVQNFDGVVSLLLPGDRIVSVHVYEGDGSEELRLPE